MGFSVEELKSKKVMKEMAKSLEDYLSTIESYVVLSGLTEEEYNDAVHMVKKLIKKLKKGDTSVYVDDLETVLDELNNAAYPF